MKGNAQYITENNFMTLLYNVEPNINFTNTFFVDSIKKMYFDVVLTPIAEYKAKKEIKRILKEKGCISKAYAYTKQYWRLLGYTNDNEIRCKIYAYLKSIDPKKYDMCYDNDYDKFNAVLLKYLRVFNFDNKEYYNYLHDYVFNDNVCLPIMTIQSTLKKIIKTTGTQLSVDYWVGRGFSEDYAKNKVSDLQKDRSYRCIEHYINKGYPESVAIEMVSDKQRKYSLCGKGKRKYWTDLGFDDESADKLAKEFSRKSSVRCVEYWMSLGYSETDAKQKINEYNPSSESFIAYRNGFRSYAEKIKKSKETCVNNWKNKDIREKLVNSFKYGKLRTSSKSENEMFDFLINHVDSKIKHEPYLVVIPEDCKKETQNVYLYTCDGYLELKNGVIIIEFDGVIYHDDEQDIRRDDDILYLDNSIVGILRIGQYYLKCGNINDNIKNIKDALQKIENSTETRIVLK